MKDWLYSVIHYRTGIDADDARVDVGVVVFTDDLVLVQFVDPLPEQIVGPKWAKMAIRALVNRMRDARLGTDRGRIEAFARRQSNAVRLGEPQSIAGTSPIEVLERLSRSKLGQRRDWAREIAMTLSTLESSSAHHLHALLRRDGVLPVRQTPSEASRLPRPRYVSERRAPIEERV